MSWYGITSTKLGFVFSPLHRLNILQNYEIVFPSPGYNSKCRKKLFSSRTTMALFTKLRTLAFLLKTRKIKFPDYFRMGILKLKITEKVVKISADLLFARHD